RDAGKLSGGAAPLLLITTATADEVTPPDNPGAVIALNALHAGRTFRFCFTNGQMAGAVSDFLWGQEDLRPDADPVYTVAWQDDPYSVDLAERFRHAAWQRREARATVREWLWLAGRAALGGVPPGLDVHGLRFQELNPAGP